MGRSGRSGRTRGLVGAVALAVGVAVAAPAGAVEGAVPLDLEVFVGGVAANAAPGPEVDAGSTITVTYEIRNSSSEWLWSLYLYQEGVGRVTCPERHVAPNSLMVCEAQLTAQAGERSLEAFATAWPTSGGVEDSESVHYTGATAPAPSQFVNLALGRPATQSSTTQWQTGTAAGLAVDGNTEGHRDAGSVAMTYRVSEAWWEVDLGKVQNIDHVVLWNRTDCCSERLQKFHVFVSDTPFEVKDIKNTQTQPGVSDFYHQDAANRKTVVPVNRTGRYVRIQLDYFDAVLALAEVEVMGRPGNAVPPPPPSATLSLDVSVNGDDADASPGPTIEPGAPLQFRYDITNTGNRRLWSLYVWHDGVGRIDCPSRDLAVGATVTCSVERVGASGTRTDQVSAQAWDDDGAEAFDLEAIHYVVSGGDPATAPGVDVEVLVDGHDADQGPGPEFAFGAPITFTYRVRNVGTGELWGLYLEHGGMGTITCPDRHLLPGAAVECSKTATAAAGGYAATVVGSAWDAVGTRASDAADVHYSGVVSTDGVALTLEALVGGADADVAPGPMIARGGTAALSFEIQNTGAETLWGLWVNLPGFGSVTCAERQLAPGASTICTSNLSPPSGTYGGSARATAYNSAGEAVEALDPFHFFVPESNDASVRIEFLVDGLDGDNPAGPRIREGEVMTFSYLVANVGGTELTGIQVTDTEVGAIDCPETAIQPGEVLVCTRTRVATLIETSIVATVRTDQNVAANERLYYHVKPFGREDQIILEVTINGVGADSGSGPNLAAGETAVIRYVLSNHANTATVWSAEILDPWVPIGDLACSGGPTLGHYQSMVCTATIVVQEGQQSNLVVGHAWSNNGPRLDASDRLNYVGVV
ncbi:MAG: discoidin domain-containing protein [Acidimicrobiia bacterium]